MPKTCRRFAPIALAGILLVTALSCAGCDRALFASDDKEVQQRLPYFGDDATSARAEREARRENQNIGFGYPTGPGGQ